MIILIGSEKGGVGKSTLATNISATLAKNGKDVILVDADRQGTSANWAFDRSNTDKKQVECVRQYDNIKQTLINLDQRYGYVIVDCQGRDSKELRTGLMAADILITPCRPSQPDLDTIPIILDIFNSALDINEKLQGFCVLTQSPNNPSITEISDAKKYLENYNGIKILDTVIYDRKVYRDAISLGLSVTEMDNEKATLEIEKVILEVLGG